MTAAAPLILVTGGTGFVGSEVVRQLVNLNLPVRILTRKPNHLTLPGVDVVQGDVHNLETLSKAFQGVTAVIHLVGIIFENNSTFAQAHTEVTRNVLAAAKQSGVRRFIQMSSIGTRPHARSRYHQTKWEAEELVRASGLNWTIFRASLIYGYDEHDRIFLTLSRVLMPPVSWLVFRSFAVFDGGKNQIQPVSIREVARCLTLAPQTSESIHQVIDLVGPAPLTFRELVTKIARVEGQSVLYEPLPVLTSLRAALYLTALFLPLFVYILSYAPNDRMMAVTFTGLSGFPSPALKPWLAGLWLLSVAVFFGWRQVIIFSVPSFIPRLLSGVVGFGEQFKMAEEDNVGNPALASKLFHYQPENLDQALKDYFC